MSVRLAVDGGTPVRDTFLVFGAPFIQEPDVDELLDAIRSGWVGTGPKVARFEQEFAKYIGASNAIAVSSCTAALHLSLLSCGVGAGDEVITSPMTFGATANVIIHAGAVPVFVDVDRTTMNLDPSAISRAVTERTRAILPVHFAGLPCDMDAILSVAREHDLRVIEDAAHCIEGWHGHRKVGTIGDATCFSFYVTKNLTTVEGGMVTTENAEIAQQIKTLALHGLSKDAWARYSDKGFKHYEVVAPGFKYNLTDILAAIGIHQLERIGEWANRREEIWRRYDEAFSALPVDLPPQPPSNSGSRHARHLYTLLLRLDELNASRDEVLGALHSENIGCGVHYVGVHLHRYYRERFGHTAADFPNATFISERTISLPFSAKLTDDDVQDVVAAVRKVLNAYGR